MRSNCFDHVEIILDLIVDVLDSHLDGYHLFVLCPIAKFCDNALVLRAVLAIIINNK
jgi:hypothetical protein